MKNLRDEHDKEKEGWSRCCHDDVGGGRGRGGRRNDLQMAGADEQQQHGIKRKEIVGAAASAGRAGLVSNDSASSPSVRERGAAGGTGTAGFGEEGEEEAKVGPDGEETVRSRGTCSRAVQHRHAGGTTENAIRHFHDAMSSVDPGGRSGWDLASTKCPESVLVHECCPCYFLVACDGDPWNAAVRMCSYWTERIDLFEDRAFQPITLGSDVVEPTGFTKEDVEVLMTGASAVLPPDGSGKTIIFREETRLQPYMADLWKSRVRVLWYLNQAGYTSGGRQAHKLYTIYGCDRVPPNGQFSSATRQLALRCLRLRKVMPVHNSTIFLLTRPSTRGTASIVQIMLSFVRNLLGKLFSCVKVLHGTVARPTEDADEEDAEAKESLLRQLVEAGFTKTQIPDWAGGAFTLDEFRGWTRRRRRVEQRLFWTEEQRALQLRGRGRIKSRRKRQRRNQDLLGLQEQVHSLRMENVRAKNEEVVLSRQLTEALGMVNALHSAARGSLGTTPSRLPVAQAVGQCDPLPPSVLALLEPDPIAPWCIPGRFPPRAGHEKSCRDGSSLETFLPTVATQPSSAILGPMHLHTQSIRRGLTGTNSLPHRQPTRTDRSHSQDPQRLWPLPLSTMDGALMPEPLVEEGHLSPRDHHGMTLTNNSKVETSPCQHNPLFDSLFYSFS
jgi:hypothetical protein